MASIQDVYGHLKTLTKKWFYDKTETDNLLNEKSNTNHTHSQYLTQHQSLANYIQKSSTNGLLKNDGSVDTTQYLSSLPSHNHDDTEINSSYTDIEMSTIRLATLNDVLAYNEPFTRINRALEHMLDNWDDYD